MFRRITFLFVLICTVAAGEQFTLAPGDKFTVSVFAEVTSDVSTDKPFSGAYIVDPDGNIQVHILGSLHVEGMNLDQVRELFNERLVSYVVTPDITVTLNSTSPRYVYVLGYVVGQRKLQIGTRDTVLDCIARCGGELYDARLDAVKVVRGGLSNPEIITVDLLAVIREGDFSQNIAVQTGDIIYVPRTALYEWNEILSRIFPSLSLVDRTEQILLDYQDLNP
jgi:polysaccharide export outer membrane protein